MDTTKAAYLPFNQAFPQQYVLDTKACSKDCGTACKEACKYDAIDLDMKAETVTVKVDSIVVATGWNPYSADKIETLGSGKVPNVINNMQMERLAAVNGPTGGAINRPSDGKPVQKIAFVQCAGSRDENHLAFCSYICCMASLKQTLYIREQNPDAEVSIFYIDMRTPGRYEKFLNQIQADAKVSFIKGKVAKIEKTKSGDVTVTAEDMLTGDKVEKTFDMVVLATGMEPAGASKTLPGVNYIEGFAAPDGGIIPTGCSRNPMDVSKSAQDATSAVLRAIHAGKGR
jgi:quinone-modifying oxidoreductase subunit QmoA